MKTNMIKRIAAVAAIVATTLSLTACVSNMAKVTPTEFESQNLSPYATGMTRHFASPEGKSMPQTEVSIYWLQINFDFDGSDIPKLMTVKSLPENGPASKVEGVPDMDFSTYTMAVRVNPKTGNVPCLGIEAAVFMVGHHMTKGLVLEDQNRFLIAGFAKYVSTFICNGGKSVYWDAALPLAKKAYSENKVSLADISDYEKYPEGAQYRAVSATFSAYLSKTYGAKAVHSVLKVLAETRSMEAALTAVTGKSLSEIDTEWKSFLANL